VTETGSAGSAPRDRRLFRIGLGVLAAAALLLGLFGTGRGQGYSPDSCNYVSMADNLLAGRGLRTSITVWERPGDTMPLSFWPPLFPACMAAFRVIGLSRDMAARLVLVLSLVSAVLLVALLADLLERGRARTAGVAPDPIPAILAGALCLLSVPLLHLAFWVWSDLPALVLDLAVVVACLRAADPEERRPRSWFALAGLACAAAMLTRFAGVGFWLLLVVAALLLPRRREGIGRGFALGTAAAAILPFAAWLLRNRLVTGRATHAAGPRWSAGPGVLLETIKACLADILPFPLYGHTLETTLPIPPRDLGAGLVVLTVAVLLLSGTGLRSVAARAAAIPGAGLLAAAYALYVLWIGTAQFLVGNSAANVEQRYFAPAYALLLALAVVATTPFLRNAGEAGARPVRVAALLWCAYTVVAGAACVAFARARPGFGSAEFQGHASSAFVAGLDAPRFCSDHDSGVWFLTRRPVKLLPAASKPGDIRRLAEGGFDGVLVIHKAGHEWTPYCATLEQLLAAGLEERWRRIGDFPDCAVYARR
jgi:hypothetical protein